jgi:hypothetical protein
MKRLPGAGNPVGAGLPAIERVAVAMQATPDVLIALASSLASQLPQCFCLLSFHTKKSSMEL